MSFSFLWFQACENKDLFQMKTLLDQGFDINTLNHEQISGLGILTQNDHVEAAEFLLDQASLDLDHLEGKDHRPLLYWAIAHASPKIALKLLDQPKHLDYVDEKGRTLLRLASQNQNEDYMPVVKKLISLGLDLDQVCHHHISAKDLLLPQQHSKVARDNAQLWENTVKAGISEWEKNKLQSDTLLPLKAKLVRRSL